MRRQLKTKVQNCISAVLGSVVLFSSPVIFSNCTTAGGSGGSAPDSRLTLWDEMQGAHDLKRYLEDHNETHVLKDYKHGASGYWITLQRELNGLRPDQPEYRKYSSIDMHDELRRKGLLDDFFRLANELHARYQRGEVPKHVDSVTEYIEWKRLQPSKVSSQ